MSHTQGEGQGAQNGSFWAGFCGLGVFQHGLGQDNMDGFFSLNFTPIFLGSTLISDLKLELFVPHLSLGIAKPLLPELFRNNQNLPKSPFFFPVLSLFSPSFFPSTTQG